MCGSVGPWNDDVVKPFVRPLAEKQPHVKRGFLLAKPAFENAHKMMNCLFIPSIIDLYL